MIDIEDLIRKRRCIHLYENNAEGCLLDTRLGQNYIHGSILTTVLYEADLSFLVADTNKTYEDLTEEEKAIIADATSQSVASSLGVDVNIVSTTVIKGCIYNSNKRFEISLFNHHRV